MAQTQIAFDFNDADENLPAAPAKKKRPPKKKVVVEEVSVAPMKKKVARGRMSLKIADSGFQQIEIPEDDILFAKSYYSIGDVAGMFKVNASLIRLWENEFDVLQPRKNRKGDRLFRPEDVKTLKLIYHLVRERKYTMQGAKDFIKNNKKAEEKFEMIEKLKKVKAFLNELKAGI